MIYTQAGGPCTNYDCSLRNNAGYCKVTVCMNPKYNGLANKEQAIGNSRNVSPDEIKKAVEQYRAKNMTNYDRIISMTPEELAEWIESIEPAACPWCDDHGDNCRFTHCRECWLSWLKSPEEADDEI